MTREHGSNAAATRHESACFGQNFCTTSRLFNGIVKAIQPREDDALDLR